MFTKFICQNYFRPLSTFIRGAVAQRLKRLSRKQAIPGSNPGSAEFGNQVYNCVYQVYLSK